jgi:peptidoglycan/LPS O-acetylase OafA/YrhL
VTAGPPASDLLAPAPSGAPTDGASPVGDGARLQSGTSSAPPAAAASSPAQPQRKKKPRLDHVDAIRPVKQAGVVSTHSLLAFAPGAAMAVGGSLMLLHVTREAFLFISACMLTYGYQDLNRIGYGYFYRRRAVSVALPYVCWTFIYFWLTLPGEHLSPWGGVLHFGYLLGSGYYQLYYLVVIMQFYVLFPALFWLVRKARGHHLGLLMGSLALQVLITALMHWKVLPPQMRGFWATREIISYQFYLVAGTIAALHLDHVHRWLCRNGWKVFWATVAAAGMAEAWFVAGHDHLAAWLGSGSDPLQPIVIPFNIGAIACLYLFGVWLVAPERSRRIRVLARSGSDNAYSVYLAQMVFVLALEDLSYRSLDRILPWPLVAAVGVAIVFLSCVFLSGILARTPLSVALTGRVRERWSTWLPEEWRRSNRQPIDHVRSPIDVDADADTDADADAHSPAPPAWTSEAAAAGNG